jgi:Na+-transporting methylmalonyl-CoA/oxaloacetate decarboxylase gamma subunit
MGFEVGLIFGVILALVVQAISRYFDRFEALEDKMRHNKGKKEAKR